MPFTTLRMATIIRTHSVYLEHYRTNSKCTWNIFFYATAQSMRNFINSHFFTSSGKEKTTTFSLIKKNLIIRITCFSINMSRNEPRYLFHERWDITLRFNMRFNIVTSENAKFHYQSIAFQWMNYRHAMRAMKCAKNA